ncbi:Hypothetical_protein [Hexamita inflata]|uniref:Hypothetical_protein n=1 Tax=Hexamita inflata TaxID=28002 RepID=A0AA86UZE8_9EUKA|nr:Hypothetical protein HINF_LOCUS62039 [Hexamita inflata]
MKPYFITGNICVAQCYDQASLKPLKRGPNACALPALSALLTESMPTSSVLARRPHVPPPTSLGASPPRDLLQMRKLLRALPDPELHRRAIAVFLVCPAERKY